MSLRLPAARFGRSIAVDVQSTAAPRLDHRTRCPDARRPATDPIGRRRTPRPASRATAAGPRRVRLAAARPGAASTDLLPQLHQHALDVTGGVCSLLFEHNPRNGVMQATSGYGLDALPHRPVDAGARRERRSCPDAFSRSAPRRSSPTPIDRCRTCGAARHAGGAAAAARQRRRARRPAGDRFRGAARRTVVGADVTPSRRCVPHGARAVPPAAERRAAARPPRAPRRVLGRACPRR